MDLTTIQLDSSTHAGEIDDEELFGIWAHLYADQSLHDEPDAPTLNQETIAFLRYVNGAVPRNAYAAGLTIVRFLNLCNPFCPPNESIVEWHIATCRRWIEDRLDPLVLPIAELAHGDFLCLDFEHSSSPTVVRWKHEESEPGRPSYDVVAKDLDEFVAQIDNPH